MQCFFLGAPAPFLSSGFVDGIGKKSHQTAADVQPEQSKRQFSNERPGYDKGEKQSGKRQWQTAGAGGSSGGPLPLFGEENMADVTCLEPAIAVAGDFLGDDLVDGGATLTLGEGLDMDKNRLAAEVGGYEAVALVVFPVGDSALVAHGGDDDGLLSGRHCPRITGRKTRWR
jgi:hypothetical protein